MRDKICKVIATFFYTGYMPIAPGTWASLFTVLAFWAFAHWVGLDLGIFALTTAVVSLLGIFAAQRMVKLNGVEDPRWIVIDETAGMLVSLTPLLLGVPIKPITLLAAFILFRIFDILKPFPVGWADRKVHGGLGIVLDDLFAGVYSAVILYFCRGLL